ncbi:hypothetical protein [Legionella taurinensis]|uniref:hypothetical protein n=1 Tax=Legionella taurinensis TaxID=70611 RepID=UPI000E08BA78|nr:hypothetical protein [Legionella taurinensis]MDX1836508.1 hypothetical protein [Legionella taurinensis]STY26819.1 Uncharacterised protein [Legionella taurinensis]
MTRYTSNPQPYAVDRKDKSDDKPKSRLDGSEIEDRKRDKAALEKRNIKTK